MTKDIKSYYQTLGVSVDASMEEVKHAYRDLAKVWHPDRFTHDPALQKKAEAKLTDINIAYDAINAYFKENAAKKESKLKPDNAGSEKFTNATYKTEKPFSTTEKETKTAQTDNTERFNKQKTIKEKPQRPASRPVPDEGVPYSTVPRPWMRFWARYFDLIVIGVIMFFTMRIFSPELTKKVNPLVLIGVTLPLWFIFEAVVMSTFGTTPGKSILRIRVRRLDGTIPNFNVFFKRGMFIWFMGEAVGIPGLFFLSNFMSYLILLKSKKTTWDERLDLVVSHGRVNDNRVGFFVFLFVLMIILFTLYIAGFNLEFKKNLTQKTPAVIPSEQRTETVVEPSPLPLTPSRSGEEMLTADDWFERGRRLFLDKKYQESIDAVSKAIELNPEYTEAYINRGSSYKKLGKNQQAIDDYNKAIELNPQLPVAYFYRGFYYYDIGKIPQSVDDLDKAIALNPRYAMAYLFRGLAYKQIHSISQAIEDFDTAIELDPQDPKAFYSRAVAHSATGNDLQAMNDFKTAARLGSQEARDFLKKQGVQW